MNENVGFNYALLRHGSPGTPRQPPPSPMEPGLEDGLAGECLLQAPMGPSKAQPEKAMWFTLPMGLPPMGGVKEVGRVPC